MTLHQNEKFENKQYFIEGSPLLVLDFDILIEYYLSF